MWNVFKNKYICIRKIDKLWNTNNVLKSIIINKMSSIDSEAFLNCTSLTEITLLNSVTSIGFSAFLTF